MIGGLDYDLGLISLEEIDKKMMDQAIKDDDLETYIKLRQLVLLADIKKSLNDLRYFFTGL